MLLVLLLLTAVPLGYVIKTSLYQGHLGEDRFVGIENYITLFQEGNTWRTIFRSLIYSFSSIFCHVTIGLGLALLLNVKIKGLEKARNIFRSLLIFPWLVANVVAASLWLVLLEPSGVANSALLSYGFIHRPLIWLGSSQWAMPSVIALNVWKTLPLFMVMILAALQGIPLALYEAANIDGANMWDKFQHITLPSLRNVLVTLVLMDAIWSLKQFELIFLTTSGGPGESTLTLPLSIYYTGFESLRFGLASAYGIMLYLLIFGFMIFYIRIYTKGEY